MKTRIHLSAAAVAVLFTGAWSRPAAACSAGEIVTYYEEASRLDNGIGYDSSRCDLTTNGGAPIPPGGTGGGEGTGGTGGAGGGGNLYTCKTKLQGYLYKPAKTALAPSSGWPLLVWNHGSGEDAGARCDIGEYFANLGYVVFVVHRRGHGLSTGIYYEDFCASSSAPAQCSWDYLHEQVNDVKAAIDYAKTLRVQKGLNVVATTPKRAQIVGDVITNPNIWSYLANTIPLVDSSKIAIMGHSFGGIMSVLSNEVELGHKCIVDIAGCSQSWGNDTFRDGMKASVEKALRPAFFIEPMNDYSIEPTYKLAKHAAEKCRQMQAMLLGPVDIDGDGEITDADYADDPDTSDDVSEGRNIAHGTFVETKLDTWGPAAHEFMQRYFNKGTQNFAHRCIGTSIDDDDN